jgi:hypothetical protein
MLEIMTAISVCTQCVKGIERLVNRGAELEQCVGHLTRWFEAASDIKQREEEEKNPPLWKKLTFQGSIESEALNLVVARKKMQEQETQLREIICYRYGIDTYREMLALRRDLRAKREKQMYAARRRKDTALSILIGGTVLGLGIALITGIASLVL